MTNNYTDHFSLHHRYDGLGVKEIRQFLDDEARHVYKYLPEPSTELPKVPKQWLADVCATILEEKFNNWVKEQCDLRHMGVVDKKNLNIQMDSEVADVYKKSIAVSSKCKSRINIITFILHLSQQSTIRQSFKGFE